MRARQAALVAAFGFVSGLPLPLSGFVLWQWLTESGTATALVGVAACAGLPYSLKFLWAPWLDAVPPPPGLRRFGRRRGWLLAVQPLLALGCAGMAMSDPARHPFATMLAAGLVAFLSATQDILIDAWRIGAFPAERQSAAVAAYVWGYRIALLVSLSYALAWVRRLGWHGALGTLAALSACGVFVTLLAPEAKIEGGPGTGSGAGPGAGKPRPGAAWLYAAARDLATRPNGRRTLAFVALFKLGEALAYTMAPAFYRGLGLDRTQVAVAMRWPALFAALAGLACGGRLVSRLGCRRALLAAGGAQALVPALYLALAASGGDPSVLVAKVVAERFAESMADAAFLAYLSGLCAPARAATQYALLTSISALGLRAGGMVSGLLATALGWTGFYGLCMLAALPALAILAASPRPAAERQGRAER